MIAAHTVATEPGSDKATQTSMNCNNNDQALFCTVLCNMLLDRIKDTFQEAMKSYASDQDRDSNTPNSTLSSPGPTPNTTPDKKLQYTNPILSELDKKLSIVSVQSLMPQAFYGSNQQMPYPSPPSSEAKPLVYPGLQHSPNMQHDYNNRLSFIYGMHRPSMFNPYIKQSTGEEGEEKENYPALQPNDQLTEFTSEAKDEGIQEDKMEIDDKHDTEEEVNIVDDEQSESELELNKSTGSISGESTLRSREASGALSPDTPVTVDTPRSTPLSTPLSTPVPHNLSPLSFGGLDKLPTSLAGPNGYMEPAIHFELQKLLLSAALAQNTGAPTFSPTDTNRSDIPVMIPSAGPFFEKREYPCNYCEASFSYGSKLRAHMVCVHSIKSYQCRQCRKSFLDKEDYIKHLDLHPQRKFQCDKCPSSFDKQHQLSLHYRSHTNEKPYRCQICQRQFAVNDALIRHMRIHTGERPYACTVCGKRFAQKSGLTYHSYLHTDPGNRPYKCTTCGQGFVHRQALKQHLMKNHLNEQVGRILNSSSPFSSNNAESNHGGMKWESDPASLKSAFSWDNKEAEPKTTFSWDNKEVLDPSSAFKIEGVAT